MAYDPTREQVNVNSPKARKAPAWPSHLVTQVNQEDEKIRLEMQQRARKEQRERQQQETAAAEADDQEKDKQQPEACNPCRSCLRFFCKNEPNTSGGSGGLGQAAGGPQEEMAPYAEGDDGAAIGRQTNDSTPQATGGHNTESENSEDLEGLLPPQSEKSRGKKCLVLDLDETLVHSSFQPIECSFQVPIVIDGIRHEVYVLKRPFVDEFLKSVAKHFELVVFTASLSEYANPVLDTLDREGLIEHRLFRESCVLHEGQAYVKDLSRLGRKLKDCIIVDNSPLSYLYDPTNAIGCTSWFGDPHDVELVDMCPMLNIHLKQCKDVRDLLNANTQTYQDLVDMYSGKRQQEEDE